MQHLSPTNPGKYTNFPLKSNENYPTKFKTNVTDPISHRSNFNLKKTEKFHSLSNHENSQLNISLNNEEFGLTVQPCHLQKNHSPCKQISRENSKFKINPASKLNLSILDKSMENVKNYNENSGMNFVKFPSHEEILIKEDEFYEIPSWMNQVRKLDETFLIFDNNDEILDSIEPDFLIDEIDSPNVKISEESSDSEFLETSRTVLVSPTRFNSNISFTVSENEQNSFCENQTESMESQKTFSETKKESNDDFLAESKDISFNEIKEEKMFPPIFCNSGKNHQFQEFSRESSEFIMKTKFNQCLDLSNEPVKKRKRTDEDRWLDFRNDESLKKKNSHGNKLNIEKEKINNFPVKLKLKLKNKITTKDIINKKLALNNYEMGSIDSVESIITRTKNLKISEGSETDLQRKEKLVNGKSMEENDFSFEIEKLRQEIKEQASKDIEKKTVKTKIQDLSKIDFSKIEEIRRHRIRKKYLKQNSDDFEKRLKILFETNVPLEISTSDIQFYDQFLRMKKRRKRKEKDYLSTKQIDSTTFCLSQGENFIKNKNKFTNIEPSQLSEVERKIQCNIDLLRSSTDSLISSVEEKVSNLNSEASDYFINETYIIKEIQSPRQENEKYILLPILENSINLSTKFKKRNFREASNWRHISRIPIHRLIGSETIKQFRRNKVENRNPRQYKFPFVAGKSR